MDPFVYNFVLGGVIFVFGAVLAWRQGSLGLSGSGRRNLCLVLGVVSFYFILQAFLQYKAPGMPSAESLPYKPTPKAEAAVDPGEGYRGATIDYAIMIGYFLIIVVLGAFFGRNMKSTDDFFFGGRKFAWWLIAFSMVATTIGSYSFLKYSSKGYEYGLSSTQTYSNDWIYFPLLLFCWLPILYFSRITSIPEYFGRRFNSKVRFWATICLLVYMVGYVGVNLFTMGKVLNNLLGWETFWGAVLVAVVSVSYVSRGGQTSVIMTDLFQSIMLLITGFLILGLGIGYLGGFDVFWDHLPGDDRKVFHNFNDDPGFPSVGIFWQDGLANSIMFGFLHQGTIMRYLSARSYADCKKAVVTHLVVLMPLAACVVGGAGWLAKSLANHGDLPGTLAPGDSFYAATQLISQPGIFGLILAAMIAALMSTVDTLITAISAVWVNDVYRPYPSAPKVFKRSISTCFKKYIDFSGSASRSEFWSFFMFYNAVCLVAFIADGIGFISLTVVLALLLPSICVSIRRLHDLGKSGWWYLLILIPCVGVIVLLVWFVKPGYGDDPLQDDSIQTDVDDRKCLRIARFTAIGATLVGIAMVPVFMNFDSIYNAHGAFTAAVTPPLVVTFVLSVFWKRFTATAALATMVVGLLAVGLSIFVPEVITPFSHGVPMGEAGEGLFGGAKQYKFMRACFGLSVCTIVGVTVSFFTKPETKPLSGLVWEKGYVRSLKID